MANSGISDSGEERPTGRGSAERETARAETKLAAVRGLNVLRLCREKPLVLWGFFVIAIPLALAAFVAAQNPAPYGREGEFARVWMMFAVVIGVPWLIVSIVTKALDLWTPLGRAPLLLLLSSGELVSMLINRAALSLIVPVVEPLIIGPLAFERAMVVVPALPPDFASVLDTFQVNFIWILIWIGLVFTLDRGFDLRLFQTGRGRDVTDFGRGAAERVGILSGGGDGHAAALTETPTDGLPSGREKETRSMPPAGALLERCKFVGRQPEDIRMLRAEDHYLRVFGDDVNELVLFRMSDALRELASVEGAQVHRSYWVARRAVEGFSIDSGQYELRLKDGTVIPVSRTFIDRARNAGLLQNRL